MEDLKSKKLHWKDIGVPDWLISNPTGMLYEKPSIIQAQSITQIIEKRDQNFIVQSKKGSGKTGAFAVPAVMTVDPNINDYQVIILAPSTQLIN